MRPGRSYPLALAGFEMFSDDTFKPTAFRVWVTRNWQI
jgi:hypothetical protein